MFLPPDSAAVEAITAVALLFSPSSALPPRFHLALWRATVTVIDSTSFASKVANVGEVLASSLSTRAQLEFPLRTMGVTR